MQIAAFQNGQPIGGVVFLPCWANRNEPRKPAKQHGVLFYAFGNRTGWYSTVNGKIVGNRRSIPNPWRTGVHVGWPLKAKRTMLISGPFAAGSTACCADFAELVTGRQFASVFAAALWDIAPFWPILKNLGYNWYSLKDLQARHVRPMPSLLGMFDEAFRAREFWIVARTPMDARKVADAITVVKPFRSRARAA